VATAVAGSVMGINPFNQPDVESAKIETRALTAAYEQTGKLPERDAGAGGRTRAFKLYATEAYAATLKNRRAQPDAGRLSARASRPDSPRRLLCRAGLPAHVPRARGGDSGLPAQGARRQTVATCLGFGPRFLHSTGQDYKGGPNTGVFLQITADHAVDVEIPGQKLSFGVVIDAQAAGDLAVLESRGRRALRVHLGSVAGSISLASKCQGTTS
jgi:hypothetical protein